REPQPAVRGAHHGRRRGHGLLLHREQPRGPDRPRRQAQVEGAPGAAGGAEGGAREMRKTAAVLALTLSLPACGGSSTGSSTPTPSPSSGPSTSPPIASPCSSALAATEDVAVALRAPSGKEHGGLGADKRDARDLLWTHRLNSGDGRVHARDLTASAAA